MSTPINTIITKKIGSKSNLDRRRHNSIKKQRVFGTHSESLSPGVTDNKNISYISCSHDLLQANEAPETIPTMRIRMQKSITNAGQNSLETDITHSVIHSRRWGPLGQADVTHARAPSPQVHTSTQPSISPM